MIVARLLASPTRAIAVIAAVVPAALIAAACDDGGGGTVAADDWVERFCSASAKFNDRSSQVGSDLQELDYSKEGAKDALLDGLEDQRGFVADFERDVKDIGRPDIENGGKVADAVAAVFDDNKDLVETAISKVKDLDEGPNFEAGVNDELGGLDDPKSLRDRLEAINKRDVDDLVDALDANSDCSDSSILD